MKVPYPTTSHYFRFFIVFSIFHQASTLTLPMLAQDISALHAPTLNDTLHNPFSNDLTTDQNIENLLASLAFHTQPQISQATFLGLILTAGDRSPDLSRSSDITTFRKITLMFGAGGTTPTTPAPQRYFRIRNRFPDRWEEWGPPDFFETPPWWLDHRQPVPWGQVQSMVPISFADSLLKDAGYAGSYEAVYLDYIEGRPLQYCFKGVWPGPPQYNAVVEVYTGLVEEVNYLCGVAFHPDGRTEADGTS